MQIDPNNPVSVETVNKKLEAFVEVLLAKLVNQELRIIELEKKLKKQTRV